MRATRIRPAFLRLAVVLLAAAALVTACSGSRGPAPSRIDRTPEGGFTITQDARIGSAARGDFADAMRRLSSQDYAGGVEKLREVTEAAPDVAAAHINLGIAYGYVNDWTNAEASLRRALELSPQHPVAHNELGIALRHQGRFADARVSYEAALGVVPDFHYARRNLAILCDLFLTDSACAIEHYEIYARAFPEDPSVVMWITDLKRRSAMEHLGGRP